jgi:hypothetical protein
MGLDPESFENWEKNGTQIAVRFYPTLIEFVGHNPCGGKDPRSGGTAAANDPWIISGANCREGEGLPPPSVGWSRIDRELLDARSQLCSGSWGIQGSTNTDWLAPKPQY